MCPLDPCNGERNEITGWDYACNIDLFELHFSNGCTNFLVLNICIFVFSTSMIDEFLVGCCHEKPSRIKIYMRYSQ